MGFFDRALDAGQIARSMSTGTLGVGVARNDAGFTGDLADYEFDFVDGQLQVTDTRPASILATAYWTFNETSGPTAFDSAGTPQNGTYFGSIDKDDAGPPALLAPFGAETAAEFKRNTSQYVAVAHDAAFEVVNGTVAFWFNTDRVDRNQTMFAKDHDSKGDGGQLNIGLEGRDLVVRLESDSADFEIDTDGTDVNNLVSANRWHHLAVTFGEAGMKLYFNGMLVGENTFTGGLINNHEAIVIGGSNSENTDDSGDLSDLDISQPFDGHIDEVGFFGRALSGTEIRRLRSGGTLSLFDEALEGKTIDGTNLVRGVEHITFADGTRAYVLGSGSENALELSVADVEMLAGSEPLAVLGDETQELRLEGEWSNQGLETIGNTTFTRYTNGPATVRVIEGLNVTVDMNSVTPITNSQADSQGVLPNIDDRTLRSWFAIIHYRLGRRLDVIFKSVKDRQESAIEHRIGNYTKTNKPFNWSDQLKNSEDRKNKAFHRRKFQPYASWIKRFNDVDLNRNSEIQVVIFDAESAKLFYIHRYLRPFSG